MAPQTSASDDVENVDFLLTVIMTAKNFEPDFEAAAAKFGIENKHNAQRKFKFIAEKSKKYDCKKNVIIDKPAAAAAPSSLTTTTASTTQSLALPTPQSKTSKKRAAPAAGIGAKKRKISKHEEIDDPDATETDPDLENDDNDSIEA